MTHLTRIVRSCLFCPPALALFQFPSFTQDWPQWRGPNRDGAVASFAEPRIWPERLTQKWQVSVGTGHSSPVVANQKAYLLSRIGEQEAVSCFNLDTGKLLWRDAYPAPYTMNSAATSHGKGPKSTPVFHNGKLYTLGISGILSCYDTAAGKVRWRKDFAAQYPHTSPLYGTAMSPLVDRGFLITHVGGNDNGALIAFDAETGELRWSWKGDGPGYASPIVVELAGTRQVVTQSQKHLVGVSAANGDLLWSIPFTTSYIQNIVTPVLYRDMLIFSGLDKGVMAIRVIKQGNNWITVKVWENSEVSFYMSTPVIKDNLLVGMSHKRRGQVAGLDANSGTTLWTSDGRRADNAAILRVSDTLALLTSDAELIIARTGRGVFEVLRSYTVARSPTWAHPVLTGTSILIKDADTLALWRVE